MSGEFCLPVPAASAYITASFTMSYTACLLGSESPTTDALTATLSNTDTCATHVAAVPCSPVPGFISKTIFSDSIQPGWNWLPYNARNSVLLAENQGVDSSVATCTTLSRGGAVKFQCRQCSRAGYQPFAKAKSLRFDIRSNTQSDDEFASSTPRGELPGLKLFLMNVSAILACSMHAAAIWDVALF